MIIATPRLLIQSEKALRAYLEDDLRFDMSALDTMNVDIIKECIETGKKKSILELLLKTLHS